jgi:restriction system protein
MSRRKNIPKNMPAIEELINPTVSVLQSLGGYGNLDEIYNGVLTLLKLSDSLIEFQHSENSSQSEIQYRLAWARTYLKNYGIIDNSSRGVWSILSKYKNIKEIDVNDCLSTVKNKFRDKNNQDTIKDNISEGISDEFELPEEIKPWRVRLLEILINMDPFSFERLAQRLLRECGFSEVNVTKKTGDGGIDGFGRLKINGIFSFKVAFQCKRYKGIVPTSDVRDFRGSLTTDFEKAIFITTGSFSAPAKEEAFAQGKVQIDLIDGEEFINKLAEFNIGVKEVKDYVIDEAYFSQL